MNELNRYLQQLGFSVQKGASLHRQLNEAKREINDRICACDKMLETAHDYIVRIEVRGCRKAYKDCLFLIKNIR